MARLLHVLTHPEVEVDPLVPVPQWQLSAAGRRRVQTLLRQPWLAPVRHVLSSAERKARDTAEPLAAQLRLGVAVDPDLGENDRSATGFVPPAQFEQLADAFFARPSVSVRGWETAEAAQARVSGAVHRALARCPDRDVVLVTHGGRHAAGCGLRRVPVSRVHDQLGQGSTYAVDLGTMRRLTGWQRLPG